MKKLVTVKRDIDGRTRVYEVPADLEVQAGDRVYVEFAATAGAIATATQDAIEVEDDIVAFFTDTPLRRVIQKDEF